MVTSNDAPENPDNPIKSVSSHPPEQPVKPSSIILPVVLLLAIVSLLCSAYAMYKNSIDIARVQKHTRALQEALKDNKTEQTTLASDVRDLQNNQNEAQEKLSIIRQNLHTLLQESRMHAQDWALLKARYYLELAQINHHWTQDLATTIALLKQADSVLAQLHDPNILPVRETLAKEISAQENLPQVDIAGLLSHLDAISTHLNELPPSSRTIHPPDAPLPKESENLTWRQHLLQSFQTLQKLVIIRRQEDNTYPFITSQQENMLKENIHLNLEEAKWAVLQGNDTVYQLALSQSIAKMKQLFDTHAGNTQQFIKQLRHLQAVTLSPKQPKLGDTLQQVNQLVTQAPGSEEMLPSGETL